MATQQAELEQGELDQPVGDLSTGERIYLMRRRRHMNQLELARAAKVSPRSLARYEAGESDPPADAVRRLAVALSTSADYLVRLKATPS